MGGPGSGRYWHYDSKETTDCYRVLDIRRINRDDLLTPGKSFRLNWKFGGQILASVDIRTGFHRLILSYRHCRSGEEWIDKCYPVDIDWTPCNFGGWRPWFCCPHCYGRVVKLYIGSSGLGCRKCYRMTYASTRTDAVTRVWRKQEKLEAKLIDDGDQYQKPKGMHWRTFNRIVDQINELELEKDRQFIIGVRRIMRMVC